MKKIMFNDKYGLTKAVLNGQKTMTRRVIPIWHILSFNEDNDPSAIDKEGLVAKHSRYKVGEVIAIAQAYKNVNRAGYPVDSRYDPFRTAYSVGSVKESNKGWNNKMFVRADIMPRHIKITDIKVERLQDISDEDCLKEGIMEGEWDRYYFDELGDVPNHITFKTAREAFAALIDKVSGKGTWQSNPWVFVYEFDLIRIK